MDLASPGIARAASEVLRFRSGTSRPGPAKHGLQLMTIPEAAEYLAISSRKLYQLARHPWARHGFPAFKIHGTWYVDRDEVLNWLFRLVDREQVLSFSEGKVVRRQVRQSRKRRKHRIR